MFVANRSALRIIPVMMDKLGDKEDSVYRKDVEPTARIKAEENSTEYATEDTVGLVFGLQSHPLHSQS